MIPPTATLDQFTRLFSPAFSGAAATAGAIGQNEKSEEFMGRSIEGMECSIMAEWWGDVRSNRLGESAAESPSNAH